MSAMMFRRLRLAGRARGFWRDLRSNDGCAMCLKPHRPWRKMMAFPLGGMWALVCSGKCWDELAARRDA